VHRDIKPENVLFAGDLALVTDFGVARVSTTDAALTDSGVSIGTPGYMSPEQARDAKKADHRSDQYSLACLVYELLAGHPPFLGASAQEVLARHSLDPVPPLHSARPEVPPAVEQVIKRALSKTPAERFATVVEFANALVRAAQHASGPRFHLARHERTLAGITLAVAIAAGLLWFANRNGSGGGGGGKRLAILALSDVGKPRDEYFAAALIDEITTRLVRVPRLEIKARNNRLPPPSSERDVAVVGRELAVDYVLDGSVNWAPGGDSSGRVRVLARLTNVATGTLIWSDPFEGAPGDVFKLYGDIAERVATALQPRLAPSDVATLRAPWTRDTQAHRDYTIGRFQWKKRTPEGLRLAVQHFRRAVDRDPGFGRAWAGLADAYVLFDQYGATRAPDDAVGIGRDEAYERARDAGRRAIQIDSTLAESHASLGEVFMYRDRDWATAEHYFREAIRLDPGYATAHQWFAELLAVIGRPEEALDHGRRAAELDPTTPIVRHAFAISLLALRRYDDAAGEYGRLLELDPSFGYGQQGLLWAQLARRDLRGALAALEAAGDTSQMMKAWVRGVVEPSARRRAASLLLRDSARVAALPLAVQANLFAGVGLDDRALDVLSRIVADTGATIPGLKVLPLFDRLRTAPRFRALVAKMNFIPDR